MIKSMTGFGKCTEKFSDYSINVEIRSLNSKNADVSVKLPSSYRSIELLVRNEIIKKLERGKIDVSIYFERNGVDQPVEINYELAAHYHEKLKKLSDLLKEDASSLMREVLRMPDVIKSERKEADEQSIKDIFSVVDKAVKEIEDFRKKEGVSLENDVNERLKTIISNLEAISKTDSKRIEKIKERIDKHLSENLSAENIDKNRLEQELIYYIEKLDINEEKVRLNQHIDYFKKTMKEVAPGRKLNFIAQEMGREINTIGSKANDAEIQKMVVVMKDELEKIKEQSNNIL
ncbi:MAG: YicC/YloC family endoribonuclease [Bacteroidia bacterium]